MKKIAFENNISETLLINLYFRARENGVQSPILKDEFSGEIVKKIEYNFAKFDGGKLSRVGTAIRAKFFDDEILRLASDQNKPVIVQVGAGLDTRPLRLEGALPNAAFYDLDLPDVIALRDELVPKATQNFSLPYSMFDDAWIKELAKKHENGYFIFVFEGISMYFDYEIFGKLLAKIAANFKGAILLDCLSKFGAKQDSKKHDTLRFIANPPKFIMGVDSAQELQNFSPNLRHVKTGYMMDMYLDRWGFAMKILRLLPFIRNSIKMFVFEIK